MYLVSLDNLFNTVIRDQFVDICNLYQLEHLKTTEPLTKNLLIHCLFEYCIERLQTPIPNAGTRRVFVWSEEIEVENYKYLIDDLDNLPKLIKSVVDHAKSNTPLAIIQVDIPFDRLESIITEGTDSTFGYYTAVIDKARSYPSKFTWERFIKHAMKHRLTKVLSDLQCSKIRSLLATA